MPQRRLWPKQRPLAILAAYFLISSPLVWSSLQQEHRLDRRIQDASSSSSYAIAPGWRPDTDADSSRRYEPVMDAHDEPNDQSALQMFAPARQKSGNIAVRAPSPAHAPRRSESAGASTLLHARSLQDWEVEDVILLATADGSIYARDRKTGAHKWGPILSESPVIETIYHRENSSSGLQYQYNDALNDFVWIVEPTQGGDIYLFSKAEHGMLQRLNLTVRDLQEKTPWDTDEPAVVYSADKKTTFMTFDAATGEWRSSFGSGLPRKNDKTTCRYQGLGGYQEQECGLMGSLKLGRVTYTIRIDHRITAEPICTLKYSEWVLNSGDGDLHAQHKKSMDQSYIYSKHNGGVHAMKHDDGRSGPARSLWHHRLPSPVVRVFDVVKPANSDSLNSDLIVLAQPVGPLSNSSAGSDFRAHEVFVNYTTAGGWYALSEQTYPLITEGVDKAQCYESQWRTRPAQSRTISHTELEQVLVGVHSLAGVPNTDPRPPLQIAPPDLPKPVPSATNLPSAPSKEGYYISKPLFYVVVLFSIIISVLIPIGLLYLDHSKAIDIIRKQFEPTLRIPQAPSVQAPQKSPVVAEVSEYDNEEQAIIVGSTRVDRKTDDIYSNSASESVFEKPAGDTVSSIQLARSAPDERADRPEERSEDMEPYIYVASNFVENATEVSGNGDLTASPQRDKKKARRGTRGGKAHRRKNKGGKEEKDAENVRDRDLRAESDTNNAVEKALDINNEPKHLEPDVVTVIPGGSDPTRVNDTTLQIGQLTVLEDKVLGYGSHGTCVFQGKFSGRDVAVKRMLKQLYDIAAHEVTVLQESDDHANVIRYYMMESAGDFMYIALELCPASLADVTDRPHEYANLTGHGGLDMVDALRQITMGIRYLHSLKIVHRDIKPENILLSAPKKIPTRPDFVQQARFLISDFGLCKKLELDQSSFRATTAHAAGTSGWRAPELLVDDDENVESSRPDALSETQYSTNSEPVVVDTTTNRRVTRAIDIFALGCIFYYVLSKGSHPFDGKGRGEGKYMRELNIIRGNHNLDELSALGAYQGEADDLIGRMLTKRPRGRPDAGQVLVHPFFWSAADRLDFLCHVSDQFEFEPRDPPSEKLQRLEAVAQDVIQGCRDDFLKKLPTDFVATLGKQRKYKGDHMLDLLRALRNKKNHYEDMPENVKVKVGSLPEGYLLFWTERFPKLLMRCHQVVKACGWENEGRFRKYYSTA